MQGGSRILLKNFVVDWPNLTLASLDHTPQSALVICFGMGTTFRSVASWNISSTAVELVPSVPRLFSFYHPDAPQVMASPLVKSNGLRRLPGSKAAPGPTTAR